MDVEVGEERISEWHQSESLLWAESPALLQNEFHIVKLHH